jgi:hypothetical protein
MGAEEYKNNWKWLEIIRYPPKDKEETPTEKIRRELETTIGLVREAIKSTDVDKIVPKLRMMLADEQMSIKEYEVQHKLFEKISFSTGLLEEETKALKRIIEDERKHERELQRIIDELTR